MGINLQCILDLLHDKFNIEPIHIDNIAMASVTYHFSDYSSQTFDCNSCISEERLNRILANFGIGGGVILEFPEGCSC